MDTTARASAAASALERQRRRTAARLGLRRGSTVAVGRNDHVSVPRLTTKHGRRRHFGRYGHATWISASLSRPSHAITSNSSCSGRWRRCVESPHDDHRTTSHSKRLEALTDVPSSSDRLDYLNSVVDCSVRFPTSNCTVRWSAILQDKTRAQTRIVQKTTAHAVFWRGLDCSVEQVIT